MAIVSEPTETVTAPAPSAVGRPSRRRRVLRLMGRRCLIALPILVIVSLGIFALAQWSPFDPVEAYAGAGYEQMSEAERAATAAALGLDEPFWAQWWNWLQHAVTGDLGHSHVFDQPVSQVLAERMPWTLLLSAVGLALAVVLGTTLGLVAGLREGGLLDRICSGIAMVLQAVPPYVLSLGAILIFAVTWNLFPAGGLTSSDGSVTPGSLLTHLALPAAVLGISQLPWFVLSVRDQVLDALASDPVRGARARGLSERQVIRGHVLPVSLAPLATLVGVRLPELVVGAVLVEEVFGWPGIAAAMVDSAQRMDFPLLAALTLVSTVVVLLGSALADALYVLLDPRVSDE